MEDFTPLQGEEYKHFLQTGNPENTPWLITNEIETITINYTSGT
jgi:fatty-acyl-CoA synthase